MLEFFKPPNQRDGSEYNLFLAFLRIVERRGGMVNFYQNFPPIETLLIIDTVISGRSSWTIFDELEKSGVKVGGVKIGEERIIKPVLIIDKEGKKLRSEYRKYVNRCQPPIEVSRILTEDRGAALEGVAAVVYPDLILAAHKNRDLCPHQEYPLFGNWHPVPYCKEEQYLDVFNRFFDVIGCAISGNEEEFKEQRRKFCRTLSASNILSSESGISREDLRIPYPVEGMKKTSAHVFQVCFSERTRRDLIRKILKEKRKFEEAAGS